jgi:small subunit ribosomal protein S15
MGGVVSHDLIFSAPERRHMALFSYQKEQIIKKFQRGAMDTGSSEVQIALLTFEIRSLTEHFKAHKKDEHSRIGLVTLVNRRKKLLQYLRKTDPPKYTSLIAELELRK